jgi:hypothetical protein
MTQKYYNIRIRIANADNVQLEIYDTNHNLQGEPGGSFTFKDKNRTRIIELQEITREGRVSQHEVEELGELLFNVLFDEGLRRDFLDVYQKAQNENAVLRLELDVDEQRLPEVAALPWEYMYLSPGKLHGAIWLAAAPNMVFSRRRALWRIPGPVRLETGEPLRIALVVAAPKDLGPVLFQPIYQQLKQDPQFEIFEIFEKTNRQNIDTLFETKKPHVFHFIGHGRLMDENRQETGQVALEDPVGNAELVSANYFSELFNRHRPGLVVLHSCESGALSSANALVGIASLVVQMNVPAVVAMQFRVSNVTAQRFALEFYRRLAANEPVDKAVQEARRYIALGPAGFKTRDFATPVLFMRDPEGRLFQRPGSQIAGVQQDKTLIMQLQEKLYDKCDELDERTYFDVGKRLKTMREKGIDDQGKERIQLLREFLDGKLTSEEFIDRWGIGTAAQAREKSPDYQTLAALLKRGELIPFLGPGVLPLSGFPDPSSPGIVEKMAQKVDCSKFKGTLPMISQYCKSEKKHTKKWIIDDLKELLHEEKDSTPPELLYEMLAGIEVPILVVSTSYDDLLEFSFCQKRKKFAVVSHHVQADKDFGKLRVQYSDKPAPDRLYKAEEISELKLLDDGYSIIYKICGRMNLAHDNNQPARELLNPGAAPPMIFEEEFFIFARYLEQSIPDFFIRKFSDSGFLFMGYNLDDWQDRLIAYVILEKWKNGNNSFTVSREPNPYERTFWKSLLSTELYGVALEEFIEKLHQHMNKQENRT